MDGEEEEKEEGYLVLLYVTLLWKVWNDMIVGEWYVCGCGWVWVDGRIGWRV